PDARKTISGLPAMSSSKVTLVGDALVLQIDGASVTFEGISLVLGRDPSVDHHLQRNDVDLFHAQILRTGERWFVRDLGSKTGTNLNGERIAVPSSLADGDALQLGGCAIRVVSGAGARSAPTDEVSLATGVAHLILTDPAGNVHDIAVRRTICLGRDPARCDHLFPADSKLSGLHCEASPEPGGIRLTDHSTNGTFVDGARMSTGLPQIVRPGQRITLGASSAAVQLRSEKPSIPTQAVQAPALERVLTATVHAGDGAVHRVRLDQAVIVGRDSTRADLIPQGDNTVSGAHARLEMANEGLRLTDLGSSNGTTVDGRRLAANSPQIVIPGAGILLGSTRVDLEWDEA
ncbi:MAG: pSer/pThr/pTyr-binding forkhead associated (FHA) protein, partial [Kiritimatiellia bacterium]